VGNDPAAAGQRYVERKQQQPDSELERARHANSELNGVRVEFVDEQHRNGHAFEQPVELVDEQHGGYAVVEWRRDLWWWHIWRRNLGWRDLRRRNLRRRHVGERR
jgi:hypothetical protein